ncbi:hypothetical protein CQA38_08640 [Campylobacter sp. MIT 12-5580]|nr:hypothetical protein CQA38_08640 [Campylobacter sp. MIT 12-5580]
MDPKYILHFYIIDGGISQENKQIIQNLQIDEKYIIEFITIDTELFQKFPQSSQEHISIETNYRFLVSSLKSHLDKCIFLDADLIFLGDISKLWQIDIKDYYIAAVSDQTPLLKDNHWILSWISKLPLPSNYAYINTGVTLINLKKWREDKVEALFFQNIEKYHKILAFPDQDILNITLYKHVKYLSHIYNAMPIQTYANKKQEKEAFSNPQIIHWAGYKKPWLYIDAPYADKFWYYAKKTPFYDKMINSRTIYGASQRIKSQLSYKLGSHLLEAKSPLKALFLPITLSYITIKHKIRNFIFAQVGNANPDLKLPKLNTYADYHEALEIQEHLSYKLGNALINHPFSFIFRVRKIYKTWKRKKQ